MSNCKPLSLAFDEARAHCDSFLEAAPATQEQYDQVCRCCRVFAECMIVQMSFVFCLLLQGNGTGAEPVCSLTVLDPINFDDAGLA